MPRYILLLRAVNVGGHGKLPMADLRRVLEGLGCTDVRSHLQSGNAVFASRGRSASRLAAQVEEALASELGLRSRCIVLSRDELAAVVRDEPFRGVATDGSRLLVHFLDRAPDPEVLAAHDPASLDPGRVHVTGRAIYQWCPDGVREAPDVARFVEKHLGRTSTGRNWNTVTKLAELVGRTEAAAGGGG